MWILQFYFNFETGIPSKAGNVHMVSLWPDLSFYFFSSVQQWNSHNNWRKPIQRCVESSLLENVSRGIPTSEQTLRYTMNFRCSPCMAEQKWVLNDMKVFFFFLKNEVFKWFGIFNFYIIIHVASWTYWRSMIGKLIVGYEEHLYFVTYFFYM